jgi:hypothetical protein
MLINELIVSLLAGMHFSRGKDYDLGNINTPHHFSR